MTKKQMFLASLLAVIPAAGLIVAMFFAVINEVAGSGVMWGLFGTTLLCSIVALATPVVVSFIPADKTAGGPSEAAGKSDSVDTDDGEDFDGDNAYNAGGVDADDFNDFDDDADFQDADDFDDDFDERKEV